MARAQKASVYKTAPEEHKEDILKAGDRKKIW